MRIALKLAVQRVALLAGDQKQPFPFTCFIVILIHKLKLFVIGIKSLAVGELLILCVSQIPLFFIDIVPDNLFNHFSFIRQCIITEIFAETIGQLCLTDTDAALRQFWHTSDKIGSVTETDILFFQKVLCGYHQIGKSGSLVFIQSEIDGEFAFQQAVNHSGTIWQLIGGIASLNKSQIIFRKINCCFGNAFFTFGKNIFKSQTTVSQIAHTAPLFAKQPHHRSQ